MLNIFTCRFKYIRDFIRRAAANILFIFFQWHHRIHLYLSIIVLFTASLVSYHKPFGLLFNLRHLQLEPASFLSVRDELIDKQKQEQKQAYDWLNNLLKNSNNYSHLISNQTDRSRFYDFIEIDHANLSIISSYKLFERPKQVVSTDHTNDNEQIIISILYTQQDTDHNYGRFYVGQVLYQLLSHYHSRFIITLCENGYANAKTSDDIKLIRRLVPVFIVGTINSDVTVDTYEREKQAHLQCILANFQSFPTSNYLLLLQDDAQPIDNDFYFRILSLIDDRVKQQWPLNGHRQQPAFLKIYHPRWLADYRHPSFYIIIQLIASSLFLTLICFSGYYLFQIAKQNNAISPTNSPRKPNQTWWQQVTKSSTKNNNKYPDRRIPMNFTKCHVIYYFLLITLVLILFNHSNVSWSWRSLHPSFYAIYPAPSCCLPGVVYFRHTYAQVTNYLNSIKCRDGYAIDTAFDDLPKRIQLKTYLVEPNLVHHVGLYSRVRQMYINPYLLD